MLATETCVDCIEALARSNTFEYMRTLYRQYLEVVQKGEAKNFQKKIKQGQYNLLYKIAYLCLCHRYERKNPLKCISFNTLIRAYKSVENIIYFFSFRYLNSGTETFHISFQTKQFFFLFVFFSVITFYKSFHYF